MFGPLGQEDPHHKAKEEQIERDVAEVARLLNGVEADGMRELAERCGGTWEPLVAEEAS